VTPTDIDVYASVRWRDDVLFRPEVAKQIANSSAKSVSITPVRFIQTKAFTATWKYFSECIQPRFRLRIDHLYEPGGSQTAHASGGRSTSAVGRKRAITRPYGSNSKT
jgi:hypothetical protein